jgi:hypothetical protein
LTPPIIQRRHRDAVLAAELPPRHPAFREPFN